MNQGEVRVEVREDEADAFRELFHVLGWLFLDTHVCELDGTRTTVLFYKVPT